MVFWRFFTVFYKGLHDTDRVVARSVFACRKREKELRKEYIEKCTPK